MRRALLVASASMLTPIQCGKEKKVLPRQLFVVGQRNWSVSPAVCLAVCLFVCPASHFEQLVEQLCPLSPFCEAPQPSAKGRGGVFRGPNGKGTGKLVYVRRGTALLLWKGEGGVGGSWHKVRSLWSRTWAGLRKSHRDGRAGVGG